MRESTPIGGILVLVAGVLILLLGLLLSSLVPQWQAIQLLTVGIGVVLIGIASIIAFALILRRHGAKPPHTIDEWANADDRNQRPNDRRTVRQQLAQLVPAPYLR